MVNHYHKMSYPRQLPIRLCGPRFASVLFAVLAVFVTFSPARGQIQLIGEHLNNPNPPELASIQQRPLIYLPVQDDSTVLYFTPFFVFEETADGKLKVDVDQPRRRGEPWKVRLTLLISPNALLDSMAAEVRKWAASQANDRYSRYKTIDGKSLIPTEFTYLAVSEKHAAPLFKPVVRNDITTQQPVYLEADLSSEQEAHELADKLRKRLTSLLFEVQYRLYARVTVTESEMLVSQLSVSETNGVKSLQGAGVAFNAQISPSDGRMSFGEGQSVLTRDQAEAFKAQVRSDIRVEYQLENEEDIALLQQELDRYFASALWKQEIAFDDVGQALRRLSAYNFSAQDLTPDRIQNLAVEAKNALQQEEQDKFSFSGSAFVGFLGLGGGVSVVRNRDELKKQMEDKGWVFKAGVEAFVPKSLDVYVVDEQRLSKEFNIRVNAKRLLRTITSMGAEVTTAKGFSDKSAEEGFTRLTGADIAQQLDILRQDMLNLQRNLVETKASVDALRFGDLVEWPCDKQQKHWSGTAAEDGFLLVNWAAKRDAPSVLWIRVDGVNRAQADGQAAGSTICPVRQGEAWQVLGSSNGKLDGPREYNPSTVSVVWCPARSEP